jgi:hypothetical protein
MRLLLLLLQQLLLGLPVLSSPAAGRGAARRLLCILCIWLQPAVRTPGAAAVHEPGAPAAARRQPLEQPRRLLVQLAVQADDQGQQHGHHKLHDALVEAGQQPRTEGCADGLQQTAMAGAGTLSAALPPASASEASRRAHTSWRKPRPRVYAGRAPWMHAP